MIRANRGVSPISVDNYGKIRNQLKPGERAYIQRQNEIVDEFFVNPIGPQPRPQNNHPILRNMGLVGLGAGIGALGYRYHKPLMKLGAKVINYGVDKFHHLFQSNNSTDTNSSEPIGNRAAF